MNELEKSLLGDREKARLLLNDAVLNEDWAAALVHTTELNTLDMILNRIEIYGIRSIPA